MKKVILIILLTLIIMLPIIVAVLSVGSAESPAEVSREIVDVRHTEAYEGIETKYEYKVNAWKGEFDYLPVVKTVRHEAKWEIKYQITYDNGKCKTDI